MEKISIDCRFANENTGLGRYTRSLVTALLARQEALSYALLVRRPDERWLEGLAHPSVELVTADIPHYSFAEHVRLPNIIASVRPSLHFSPHFNVPLPCPVPFVATIHDLILHDYASNRSCIARAAYRLLMRSTVHRAARLLAVSRFVAADVERRYGARIRAKTVVIGEGVEQHFTKATDEEQRDIRCRYALARPYVLYVGNCKEHKNVHLLIDAYKTYIAMLPDAEPSTELVLVTYGKESHNFPRIPGLRVLRDVPDNELPSLYSAADAFMTASLAEGYCLPAAEALACGCPVIGVQGTALNEFPSVTLVSPTVEAFAAAFDTLPPRPQPTVVGTWEAAAEATLSVLRSCMPQQASS